MKFFFRYFRVKYLEMQVRSLHEIQSGSDNFKSIVLVFLTSFKIYFSSWPFIFRYIYSQQ